MVAILFDTWLGTARHVRCWARQARSKAGMARRGVACLGKA